MPDITLQGWLNENFTPHRNSSENRFPFENEPVLAIYEATTNIDQPEILEDAHEQHGYTKCRTKIRVTSKVSVLSAEGFFNIPEYEDYVPFIKMPEVSLLLEIECESEGLFNEHHFDISRVSSLSGKLTIDMSSMVFGDTDQIPSISATQEFQLNSNNTSLRLHSFVESNRKLRDNYSLEIGIEENEDLVFS